MTGYYLLILSISTTGILYSFLNFYKIKRMKEGTKRMQEIALAIREGSETFLRQEYKVIIPVVLVISIIFGVIYELKMSFCFIVGILLSGITGYVGMKSSTYANVRTANMARKHENIGKPLKVAVTGGSVMGISVPSYALWGFNILLLLFSNNLENLTFVNNGILRFIPLVAIISSYNLGCSIIAMFNRIGGGIYTKAADIGSDQVGKNELKLDEDDPRNPGVIADCVGDNVGDVSGLGSDLFESFTGAVGNTMLFVLLTRIRYQALGLEFSQSLFRKLFIYPMLFCALGLISSIIAIVWILRKKDGKNPNKELNLCTWIAAGLTTITTFFMTYMILSGENVGDLPFRFGFMSPYLATIVGIATGLGNAYVTEYYTSEEYKPTQEVAKSSEKGASSVLTKGLGSAFKSVGPITIVFLFGFLISYAIAGFMGISFAAVGLMSYNGATVTIDTYGPIADNAGGIAEMAGLDKHVRKNTDILDAAGNTEAAKGKGNAIGGAFFTSVNMFFTYMYSFTVITDTVQLDYMNIFVMTGLFTGLLIPSYVSGMLMESVSKVADKMTEEIRRQFREIPGLKEGKVNPDYNKCIKISTEGALSEMKRACFVAILAPLSGFIFGPYFVAGILIGATASALLFAIFSGNAGGTWDNAKKILEANGMKGTLEHAATVTGDTVGDPLKDTVGPSLDIIIKIMATEAIILGPMYASSNFIQFIQDTVVPSLDVVIRTIATAANSLAPMCASSNIIQLIINML